MRRRCAASAPPKTEILSLAAWLHAWDVTKVVMEATSDYWKAPFFRLEAEGFDCGLFDAKQVKALPGRPRRPGRLYMAGQGGREGHGGWLFRAARGGIPQLRTLTCYRRHLTEERSREKQRAEKLLGRLGEAVGRGLGPARGVVPGDHGGAHRRLPGAQGPGPAGPGPAWVKTTALEEALDGADTFSDHHGFVLRMMLDNIDRLSAQIDKLTAQVEELIAPFERQVARLDGITADPVAPPRTSSPRPGWTWACSPPPPTWCRGPSSAPR